MVSNGSCIGGADACGTRHDHVSRDVDRRGQCSVDAVNDVLRIRVVGVIHDHELVSAETGDCVGAANGCHQATRCLAQHQVADVVSVCVVDVLEVVEVGERDRQRQTVALGTRQACIEQIPEQPPIGQSGERIMQCKCCH